MGDTKNTMLLTEFQEKFASQFNQGNRNVLVDLKPLFLILCHDEALRRMKELESYFNDFVHILIIVRESGLNFQIMEEKNYGVYGTLMAF